VTDAAQAEMPAGYGTAAHWTRLDVGPSSATGLELVNLALGAPARLGRASMAPLALTAPVASMAAGAAGAAGAAVASPARAEVCAVTLGNFPVLAGAIDGSERVVADDSRDELFGDGWHPVEEDAAGGFRWTAAPAAHVLVPLGRVSAIRVGVRARVWEDADAQDVVGLRVNGHRLEPLAVAHGWGTYEWSVPADAWRVGVNDVVVESPRLRRPASGSPDTRLLGIAVREIDFSVEAQRQ
jgi:hypothetical protein